jgi:disulfide bond formation protein DsbB
MKIGKALLILLIATLVLLMVACGGGGGSASSAGSNGETAAEEAPAISAGDPDAGEEKFNEVCIACHGAGGVGIEGLGKDMTASEFIAGKNDEELLAFVKTGRPIGDPLNTTGIDMPAKGGNPALTDDQILDIIAYIRILQQ